ncbi:hypothetical protein ANRL1_04838 [Anaerolineae bacterium]|nr:hypothetical protein ANRL1_04838 [Anaerolineae bacterium]
MILTNIRDALILVIAQIVLLPFETWAERDPINYAWWCEESAKSYSQGGDMIDLAWQQIKSFIIGCVTHPRAVLTTLVVAPLTLLRHAGELARRGRTRALKVVLDYSVKHRN